MLQVESFIVSLDNTQGIIFFSDGSYKRFDSPSGQVRAYMFLWLQNSGIEQYAC